MVWGISHFKSYLYGHDVKVYTDHSAVCAVLQNPHGGGKYTRWWLKVHDSGLKSVSIRYCSGRENANADALSRSPGAAGAVTDDVESCIVVSQIQSEGGMDLEDLLQQTPDPGLSIQTDVLACEQCKDP